MGSFIRVILIVICIFLMRPAHLGEAYNFWGTLLLVLSAIIAVALGQYSQLSLRKRSLVPIYVMFGLWLYLFCHGLIKGVSSPFIYYSTILAMMTASAAWLIVSAQDLSENVTRKLVQIIAFLGLSSAITFCLSILVPINALQYGHLHIPTYGSGEIFFPFSIGYGQKFYPWGGTYRFAALWREAGIAQAIFCWALVVVIGSPTLKYKRFLCISIVGGVLATQSTLAYLNLGLTLILSMFFLIKTKAIAKFFAIALFSPIAVASIWFAVFSEDVGLASKRDGGSFYDRFYAIQNALEYLKTNPWGFGLYGDGLGYDNGGINLIAQSSAIGIVGFLGVLLFWVSVIAFSQNPKWKLVALIPVFFTALTSQPLLDAFGLYLIFFLPIRVGFKSNGPMTGGRRGSPCAPGSYE